MILLVAGMAVVVDSVQFGIGRVAEPGAGMLPALAGVVLSVLSIARLVQLRTAVMDVSVGFPRSALARTGIGVVIPVCAAALVPWTGFAAASTVMMFLLAYVVARLPLLNAALLTAAISGAIYFLFLRFAGIS